VCEFPSDWEEKFREFGSKFFWFHDALEKMVMNMSSNELKEMWHDIDKPDENNCDWTTLQIVKILKPILKKRIIEGRYLQQW
jgi:hypothetical protein